jgi:hypothetical protein
MHDFDAVANGERPRARWRSPEGWVRVDRLSDRRLCVRGPRSEVVRISSAAQPDWTCMHQRQLDDGAHGPVTEMMLVRRDPAFGPGLQLRAGSRRVASR